VAGLDMNEETPIRTEFDAYAGSYEDDHKSSIAASGEDPAYFHDYKVSCLERKGVDREGPLLDFGCGIGNLTERFVAQYREVHGYDPSAKSIARAKERAPGAKLHSDASELTKDYFETAVMSGVLHHVQPSARIDLLKTVRGLLRPGGRLVVFEHNPLNPVTQRAVAACAFDDDAILLWPWEARAVLKAAGFDDVSLEYIVFFPRPLAFLRPLEPRLSGVMLGAQQMLVATKRS
jgi:2-polyprenyl-3-methyl-5-hydroxy-6-metoxy-1,4-benzoquinol methylase